MGVDEENKRKDDREGVDQGKKMRYLIMMGGVGT